MALRMSASKATERQSMFFIVWGREGIVKIIGSGNLECPLCNLVTAYELRKVQKYFTLFWIPIFPYGKAIEYLECLRCKTTFSPDFFDLKRDSDVVCDEQEQDEVD
jgi:hypothetical protein